MEKFYHVQFDLKTKEEIEAEKKAAEKPSFYINKLNNEAKEALLQLEKEYVPKVNLLIFFLLINFFLENWRWNCKESR